jgi:sialic acid synthase SpsE
MKIIAEIGSNWQTFEHAKDSISQAKAAGADAVKFQAFTFESLWGVKLSQAAEIVKSAVGIKHEMPLDWLPKLAEKAMACGIEFMCTAFSPEGVAAVDPYVETHKVASAELTHLKLLEAIARTKKPVYLSTGASGIEDIALALDILKPCRETTLMHCVAAYPARATNLRRIQALEAFGVPVGYSDHSLSCDDIPFHAAYTWGAKVLEKHMTAFPDLETPDRDHSLTVDQFRYMVDYISNKQISLASCHREELPMVLRHNRRLIATRDIAAGEKLREGENFGAYRSLRDDTAALSPWMLNRVDGLPVKRALRAGDGIGPRDV